MSGRWSALALVLLLAGCTASPSSTPVDIALPPTSGGFDYQLGGAYPADVAVVVRDAGADPLPGAYSICYVNGFQTQPEDAQRWAAHPELLLTDESGAPVVDPEWPDELVLDPSTAAQREGILEILGPVLSGCADAGFDAVEIDNLDTWTRFPEIDAAGALGPSPASTWTSPTPPGSRSARRTRRERASRRCARCRSGHR